MQILKQYLMIEIILRGLRISIGAVVPHKRWTGLQDHESVRHHAVGLPQRTWITRWWRQLPGDG